MREDGFYHVKRRGIWTISEFIDGDWRISRAIYDYSDDDFDEIDELRIVREVE